jgi:hypothetical protein
MRVKRILRRGAPQNDIKAAVILNEMKDLLFQNESLSDRTRNASPAQIDLPL